MSLPQNYVASGKTNELDTARRTCLRFAVKNIPLPEQIKCLLSCTRISSESRPSAIPTRVQGVKLTSSESDKTVDDNIWEYTQFR